MDNFIIKATENSDVDNVVRALDLGASIDKGALTKSPLFLASENCNVDMARVLIIRGAIVNSISTDDDDDYRGFSVLDIAIENCSGEKEDIIRVLQNVGARTSKELRIVNQ